MSSSRVKLVGMSILEAIIWGLHSLIPRRGSRLRRLKATIGILGLKVALWQIGLMVELTLAQLRDGLTVGGPASDCQ